MRPYQTDEDYWRIRAFLRELFWLNDRQELAWQTARWDYWRWPGVEGWGDGPLETQVLIWELPGGRIAAVANTEGHGNAYLQIHPAHRTPALEAEMIDAAEAHLAVPAPGGAEAPGGRSLGIWADSRDAARQALLVARGYARDGTAEHQHRRDLTAPVPDAPLADGFTLRALGGPDELPARAWYSWRAFNPDAPEAEYEALGWEWYLDIQRCPLYRRDLDLVAVATGGERTGRPRSGGDEIAAFTTVWYDDVTRSAYFEPVGTYPAYQRRGLARAVMTEGLRRAQRLGATLAFVTGLAPGPNRLYDAVVGPAYAVAERWARVG